MRASKSSLRLENFHISSSPWMLISSIFWKVSLFSFFFLKWLLSRFSEEWKLLSKEATVAVLFTKGLKVETEEEPLRNCEVVSFHPTPVILNK